MALSVVVATPALAHRGVADLDLALTTPTQVTAGEDVPHDLTVTNEGPDDAHGVVAILRPDARTRFVTADPACHPIDRAVVCRFGDLTPHQVRTIQVVMSAPPTLRDGTVLRAHAVVGSAVYDPNLGDNGAATRTTVVGSADLAVGIAGPETFAPGEAALYRVGVRHVTGGPATDIRLDIELDAAGIVAATPPEGCTVDPDPKVVHCETDELVPGARWDLDLALAVDPGAAPGSTVTATANVVATPSDPDPSNNTGSTTGTVGSASADLALALNGPADLVPGEDHGYTVEVMNHGPADARGVVVTLVTDRWLIPVEPPDGCVIEEWRVTCEVGTVEAAGAGLIELNLRLEEEAPADERLGVEGRVTADVDDPEPSNDLATVFGVVTPADLRLGATLDPATRAEPASGSTVTFAVVAWNRPGAGAVTDLVVGNRLPVGVELVSHRAEPDGSVLEPDPDDDRVLWWRVGDLTGGAPATLELTVRVAPDAPTGRALTYRVWVEHGPEAEIVGACEDEAGGSCAATEPVAAPEPEPEPPTPEPELAPAPPVQVGEPAPEPEPAPPAPIEPPEPEARLAVARPEAVPGPTFGVGAPVVVVGGAVVSMLVAARLTLRR